MSSSKQVAAAVKILDECGVFGRKKNRKRNCTSKSQASSRFALSE
jgi:hypothetical protein